MTGGRSSRRPTRKISADWFDRPTAIVARELLGMHLALARPEGRVEVRLVETEAYVARDLASHAYRGETPRNRSMFSAPGTVYVYRIHQVHCLNLVTRRGEAVLLRSAEPVHPVGLNPRGPGRLCRALGVDRSYDGRSVLAPPFSIRRSESRQEQIVRAPRVGIRKSVDRLLRFAFAANPWVSLPRPRPAATGASPSRTTAGAR